MCFLSLNNVVTVCSLIEEETKLLRCSHEYWAYMPCLNSDTMVVGQFRDLHTLSPLNRKRKFNY